MALGVVTTGYFLPVMGVTLYVSEGTGSNVEGDDAQASELGKMLGAAIQAELVKQKRPGGLLA